MDKKALRKSMLAKCASLSEAEIKSKSKTICSTLSQLPEFRAAKSIAFYISVKHEVHTHDIIRSLLRTKEKKIAVPVYGSKAFAELNDWNTLSSSRFGVLEPREISTTSAIDLIIVPGVAFDTTCNRLGHGRGFYDKILTKYNISSVALAYEQQIVAAIPTENHDIKVNKIITEKRIIQ